MSRFCFIDASSPAGQQLISDFVQPDDRVHAGRYRSPQKAQASMAARGLLRAMLAENFETAPEDWLLTYDDAGRPWARSQKRTCPLFVSLSHSGSHAAAAYSDTGTVGIDIEAESGHRPWLAIAEKLFPEVTPLLQGKHDFYRAWCLHESWVKAHGGSIWDETAHESYGRLMEGLLTGNNSETIWKMVEFHPEDGITGLCLSIGIPHKHPYPQ